MSQIDPRRATPSGRHRRAPTIRRGLVLAAAVAITATTVAGRIGLSGSDGATSTAPTTSPATRVQATTAAPQLMDRRAEPTPRGESTPLPKQDTPVSVPRSGPGRFRVAEGTSPTRGSGSLFTYTVEVENNLPYDAETVARFVEQTVAASRGWKSVAHRSMKRVDRQPTVHLRLATPSTTDKLCAPLQTRGRLSCRNGDLVVLNAWRWANGADGYNGLSAYRGYMVNHELGHALGYGHRRCPARGAKAPVMMQQTKGLEGCVANPWPRVR